MISPEGQTEAAVSDEPAAIAWHVVMPIDELWIGDLVGVDVAGQPILLVRLDESVRAYDDRCPHQENPLSEGLLDGDNLTCAAHLWEFDARTGQGVNPASSCLSAFPVRVDDGMICVGLPGHDDGTTRPPAP
jgi:toluene monooxygenase system ferredoxin subunit